MKFLLLFLNQIPNRNIILHEGWKSINFTQENITVIFIKLVSVITILNLNKKSIIS